MTKGFLIDKGVYAAIPFGGQLMILHDGQQLKICRTEGSARKYIADHKKSITRGRLPLD